MAGNGRPTPGTTRQIGNEQYQVLNLQGHAYATVNQRVESAHKNGGYTVVSREFKEVFDKKVCEVWIELPNGQRFPGIAELDSTKLKALHDAETSAIGRALGFAGFDVQTAIASHEEMEQFIKERGQQVVESDQQALPEPGLKEAVGNLGRHLFTERTDFETFLYSFKNHDTGKVSLQAAYDALKAKAREKLNERAAEEEREEDAHLIDDEQLVEALSS